MFKVLAVTLVVSFAAWWTALSDPNTNPISPPPADPLELLWPGTTRWTESVLDTLTLETKVAQLFVTHAHATLEGTTGAEWERLSDLVEDFHVGGILFLSGEAARQAESTRNLQERAAIPLLIAQDMEYGTGMRVDGGTSFPKAMALGATRDPALAYLMGKATAEEARGMGVHQNYAPVADINNNPLNPIINVRSFGEDPELVGTMVAAYIRGMQDGGLIATAKHFPGHGDTETDSHSALPTLPFDRNRLDEIELVPFRRAVDSGVMAVMTGHLALPLLDSERPATLSEPIISGLLREELGFEGLVVTDGLDMEGIADGMQIGEIAVRALEAGVDQLILTRDERRAHRAIMRAIDEGRITEDRIDASLTRILRAKAWAGLADPLANQPIISNTRSDEQPEPGGVEDAAEAFREVRRTQFAQLAAPSASLLQRSSMLADQIARESITLLQNNNGPVPFVGPDAPRSFLTLILDDSEDETTGELFAAAVSAGVPIGSVTTQRRLGVGSTEAEFVQALSLVSQHDIILVPSFVRVRSWSGSIELPARHKDFLEQVMALGRPVVLLAFGNPYIPLGLPEPAAFVSAFGGSAESQRAAADALFGRIALRGKLPITIPGRYTFGEGVQLEQAALRSGTPEEAGMSADVLEHLDDVINRAIRNRAFPGAAVAVGRGGVIVKERGYGYFTYANVDRVSERSQYDLASVTKVVATTAAAMKLYEEGRLDLDQRVAHYVPEFGQRGKARVTIRQLLSHSAGQRAFHPFHTDEDIHSARDILRFIYADSARYTPGTRTVYSDFDMIVLGEVIEEITRQPLEDYVRDSFFEPLGMTSTRFLGTGRRDPTVVPTESDRSFRGRLLQGEVHDEAAWMLGGVSGHAGLFSTAEDLARFAYMLTNGGEAYGRRYFRPETIELFTTRVSSRGRYPMALGWMSWRSQNEGSSSAGRLFGPRSFGHTGYTGTSIWIDPDEDLFVIMLTNRVFPTRNNSRIRNVRPALGDAAAGSLRAPAGHPERMLGFGAVPADLLGY